MFSRVAPFPGETVVGNDQMAMFLLGSAPGFPPPRASFSTQRAMSACKNRRLVLANMFLAYLTATCRGVVGSGLA